MKKRQAYRISRKEKRKMMWRIVEEIQQNTANQYMKFYKYSKNLTKEY